MQDVTQNWNDVWVEAGEEDVRYFHALLGVTMAAYAGGRHHAAPHPPDPAEGARPAGWRLCTRRPVVHRLARLLAALAAVVCPTRLASAAHHASLPGRRCTKSVFMIICLHAIQIHTNAACTRPHAAHPHPPAPACLAPQAASPLRACCTTGSLPPAPTAPSTSLSSRCPSSCASSSPSSPCTPR